jgi:hypothetical protein
MKKFLILCSVLLGFGVTGLLAEDATVSLPPAAPIPAASASNATPGTAPAGKKHHKKHHKKKTSDATPTTPAPKS